MACWAAITATEFSLGIMALAMSETAGIQQQFCGIWAAELSHHVRVDIL